MLTKERLCELIMESSQITLAIAHTSSKDPEEEISYGSLNDFVLNQAGHLTLWCNSDYEL
jgi:hypothetical protein